MAWPGRRGSEGQNTAWQRMRQIMQEVAGLAGGAQGMTTDSGDFAGHGHINSPVMTLFDLVGT
ncbi:MAG TPA: hypothetical protein DF427_07505 [Moraxellaceae bacterium]|nr:hypothetical protein [Moraxellaceae bacterium]